MIFDEVLKEISKLQEHFNTGFIDYKIVQRHGNIEFIECNLKFKIEDGSLQMLQK